MASDFVLDGQDDNRLGLSLMTVRELIDRLERMNGSDRVYVILPQTPQPEIYLRVGKVSREQWRWKSNDHACGGVAITLERPWE